EKSYLFLRRLENRLQMIDEQQTHTLPEKKEPVYDEKLLPVWEVVILPNRSLLRQKISRRLQVMLDAGWIEEVEQLGCDRLQQAPQAGKALGYPQIIEYLNGLIPSREELISCIEKKTWQYAKRQYTWFRHQHPRATRIESPQSDDMEALQDWLVAEFRRILAGNESH
ncbi:MAG: hypothetical protein D6820_16440, partial [Lentisphaerae bacterium]